MISVDFVLNGSSRSIEVEPQETLMEVLRERFALTGAKEGCGVGECGSCMVLRDGEPVPSCLVLAADAAGSEIETVESLADDGRLSDVQEAFVEAGAVQCGFCIPGMVVTATGVLRASPHLDAAGIREEMSGVLCRCGTYPRVLRAVEEIVRGARS